MSASSFSDQTWSELVSVIASGFAMTPERVSQLESNRTAKLVGALPYLAGCREPERSAIAHLAVFAIGGAHGPARETFDHVQGDDIDVLARLATIGSFEGGDPALIARGMKLLAVVMVAGYKKDVESDKAAGRYNPIGSGAWDGDDMIAKLSAGIRAVPCPEMDAILDLDFAVRGFWEP